MTRPDVTTTSTLLSDKLLLVTHHHLLTRVLVKLDLENWNYNSWELFFEQLCHNYEDTFPDLKIARSMLPIREMRLKSKPLALPVDSSSSYPMVLMAEPGTTRRSSTNQVKSWRPCFNFVKCACWFGDSCMYVHEANARLCTNNNGHNTKGRRSNETKNTTNALLAKLLQQLGTLGINNTTSLASLATVIGLSIPFVSSKSSTWLHTTTGPLHNNGPTSLHSLWPANLFPTGPSHWCRDSAYSSAREHRPTTLSGQATNLPHTFNTETLQDLASGAWNMDTSVSSHLNASITSLSDVFNTCIYPSVSVGDGHTIPITNMGHSIFPTNHESLHLNNVLITPHIVKNLIYVRQFVHDNNCTIEFDVFGFSVKDFTTRRVLLRCDSDLYPPPALSTIPHAFLVSRHMWRQCLGYPGSEELRRLVSSNFISCNKEKPLVFCHAC
nr:ribonuclease H-like domain-containing protein [Tanacetum cinerariifolium]